MIASALPLLVVVAAIVVLGTTGNLFATSPLVVAAQACDVGLSLWGSALIPEGRVSRDGHTSHQFDDKRWSISLRSASDVRGATLHLDCGAQSFVVIMTLAIGIVVVAVVVNRIGIEERLLRALYPEYDNYARSTMALVPYVF